MLKRMQTAVMIILVLSKWALSIRRIGKVFFTLPNTFSVFTVRIEESAD
jgi:hypothetical protein